MNEKKISSRVYIGVVPGVRNLAGTPFRTDSAGMYHRHIEDCEYLCRINGGKTRYFFIEEHDYFDDKPSGENLGNICKIHQYNLHLQQEKFPDTKQRTRIPPSFFRKKNRYL